MPLERPRYIMPEQTDSREIPRPLIVNLEKFLGQRTLIQRARETESLKQLVSEEEYLRQFFEQFLKVRIDRAEELNSPEIESVNELIFQLFGSKLGITSCMDGRLPIAAIWGFPMDAVRAMRVPGGDIPGFYFDTKEGHMKLDESSLFARKIAAQQETDSPTRFQVLNAHKHCAARGAIESNLGIAPDDKGLFEDVKKKREMGVALEKQYGIVPIIFVPDPDTGFGYMGLGQDSLLKEKTGENKRQYDDETIDDLVTQGKVISTKLVAEEFAEQFMGYKMDVDWENNYSGTAVKFWENIDKMAKDKSIMKNLSSRVSDTYSESNGIGQERKEEEIRVRSLLVLTNAYLGWLYEQKGGHPYREHKESCVVIDFKNKGPFAELTAFVVAPDISSVDANVVMASNIVRNNREKGNVTDTTNNYKTPDKFKGAPVSVILKTEIPADSQDEIWNDLKRLPWEDIQEIWSTMSDGDFLNWIDDLLKNRKHQTVEAVKSTLLDMKHVLLKLYRNATQPMIERGGLVVLPILVSQDRKPQTIVPLAA